MKPPHPFRRLLCVEDDPSMRASLGRLLSRHYDTTEVGSAEAALDELSKGPFDGLLTDFDLPGLSGVELCDYVRRRHPEVWCVVLTGAAPERLPPHEFTVLTKPVSAIRLFAELEREAESWARHDPHDQLEQGESLNPGGSRAGAVS